MGIPITLTLPEDLLEQARHIASLTHRDVRDLLVASISLPTVEDELYPGVSSEEAQAMALEEAAWHQLHPELVNSHKGQYVAIFQGQPVDHDLTFDALFQRVSRRFPDRFVWIDKVRGESAPILHFRSPRFVDQNRSG